jgi:hypothetical protein
LLIDESTLTASLRAILKSKENEMKKALLALGVLTASCAGFYGLAAAAQTVIGTTTLKSGQALTVACSGTKLRITRISATASAERCWGRAATATRSPPTTATTRPPATTTTAAPATTSNSAPTCTTQPDSGSGGTLGPYGDSSDINNSNGFNTYVENNVFTASETVQGVCVTSPSKWSLNAAVGPPDNGGVQAYPDVAQQMNDWGSEGDNPPLSALTDLTSTFNTTPPNIDKGNWEEAYDVWLSSNNNEVMIWTDTSSSRLSDNGATIVNPNVTFDGVSYTYQVYEQGTNQSSCGLSVCGSIDMVRNNPEASGTVDIRDVLNYLISVDAEPSNVAIGEIDFGWEICSTVGTQTFAVNGYTLTRTPVQP